MSAKIDHTAKQKKIWKEKLLKLETSICEGIQSDNTKSDLLNLFGRKVQHLQGSSLSYLAGLTLCGLRTNALIENNELAASLEAIRSAIRQHLPLTIHVNKTDFYQFKNRMSNPELLSLHGAIQFVSSNAQDVLDHSLIAHKVSEILLVPTINQICVTGNGDINEISNKQRVQFLGNGEDQIESPTPSQQMIFGPRRRRIPQWFNYDFPAQLGSKKDKHSMGLEFAAGDVYFSDHREEIISACLKEFEIISGRKHDFVSSYNIEKSSYLILTTGCNLDLVSPVINELDKNKIRVGFANINIIDPFPESRILDLIKDKKAITILEPMNDRAWLEPKIKSLLYDSKKSTQIILGHQNGLVKITDLLAIASNMASGKPRDSFYCGIEFTRSQSNYPKYQVMLQEIQRKYPHLAELALEVDRSKQYSKPSTNTPIFPSIVRQYKDKGAPYTQLSRFHDHTSLFYQTHDPLELVADPFQSIVSEPAASAILSPEPASREFLPFIDTSKCTACGNCMVNCPQAAMPSLAIGIENLLRSGMDIVAASGLQIIQMIPLVKTIAKITGKVIGEMEGASSLTIEAILEPSFQQLISDSKFDKDKLEALKVELSAVKDSLNGLPVTLSEILYQNAESIQKGTGNLFFIAVDPNVCTGCEICFESCNDEAIEMVPETEEELSKYRNVMEMWEKLPDTSSDTLNNLLFNKDYNSFAALMLSRNFYYSLTGGGRETDSPGRQMTHLIATVTESLIQPRYSEYSQKINSLAEELSSNIHSILSESLPTENFDNIAKAIGSTEGSKVPLDEIISHIDSGNRLKQVDAISLKRKIELLDSLKGLSWSLAEGPTGAGRARMGMSISTKEKFSWAKEHPFNPFISPTLNYQEEFSPEVSLGLLEGQMRNIIDNIKLIRRANLEIKNKYIPKEHDREISMLDWNSLTDEERKLVPPVLFIAEQSQLAKSSFNSICRLLESGKPLKVIVLDDLADGPDSADQGYPITSDLLSIIGLKKAHVYQGGTANQQIFFNQLIEGISSTLPAYFRIFSPDPQAHNFGQSAWPALSSLACKSRSFPYLTFNPDKYNGYLNSCMKITDNPSPENTWISETLILSSKNEERSHTFDITWADWAFGLHKWASEFKKEEDENRPYIPLSEFISSKDPKGTPVIFRTKDGELIRYSVSSKVVKKARIVKESWDLLREISGSLIEFPEKLTEHIKNEVEEQYNAELEKIKIEYEGKLKEQKQLQTEELRQRLRDKLVQLTSGKK